MLNFIWAGFFLIAFVVASCRNLWGGDTAVWTTLINATFADAKSAFLISLEPDRYSLPLAGPAEDCRTFGNGCSAGSRAATAVSSDYARCSCRFSGYVLDDYEYGGQCLGA